MDKYAVKTNRYKEGDKCPGCGKLLTVNSTGALSCPKCGTSFFEIEKKAGDADKCPKCGSRLELDAGVVKCSQCGTEPFEEKE